MSRTYTAKSGKTQHKPSIQEVMVMNEEGEGFCLACGTTHCGVEPDARKDSCEVCGECKVYGAEEITLMGLTYDESTRSSV